jgi:glycosyltransferase involved in cell wall biosynthesis
VAGRIRRHYAREATVIYPPVDVDRFAVEGRGGEYYLVVAALVPYKRVDLAIQAFNRLRLPLKVVGRGPEEKRLRAMAGPSIEFLPECSDTDLVPHRTLVAVVRPQHHAVDDVERVRASTCLLMTLET